ncbi:hypothetical protein [Pseudomonas mediterranea]|uniref:hypothetical protein n=1 Tax=Pseudomonas mediterranea TaxID=183795 RepID=UPI00187CAA0E|nr:hypothetical protein [Pseudomonas mediterranea]MDU9028725.1 hypothetical protein [Pseudomonas mediterranea]
MKVDSVEYSPEQLLARRIAGFDAFKLERLPVLHDFCKSLGFDQPYEVLNTPQKFLPELDSGFRNAVISNENRVWFITRIGYYIGEYLATVYDGCWQVDEDHASPTFGRYIVGNFSFDDAASKVDPFEIAQKYADTPMPRSLIQELENSWMG